MRFPGKDLRKVRKTAGREGWGFTGAASLADSAAYARAKKKPMTKTPRQQKSGRGGYMIACDRKSQPFQ